MKRGDKYVAIKIDLHKAYDKLRWEFIEDTLKEARFPLPFINLVMACISSVSMQVMWNRKASDPFWPSRGIHQGDLISPYLFVLCIERLAHAIKEKVDSKEWQPLKVTRYGPSLSHLFFADDLILFARVTREQMKLINKVLDDFCQASRETISREKSVIFCSRSMPSHEARLLSNFSNFVLKKDPGLYLGVPLLHQRVTARTYQRVLEKVLLWLNLWSARSLSLAGRATLGRAVVLAIPLYTMQTTSLPAKTLLPIEKAFRKFLWGSNEEGRKPSLVAWKSICQPKERGGLGFRNLRMCNKAFMIKLAW